MHLYLHASGVSNDHYQSDRAICTNDHKTYVKTMITKVPIESYRMS